MKNINWPFWLFIIGILGIILMPFLLTQFSSCINLDTDSASKIGDAIGGTTAPIVGIISIFLIYLAYNEQRKTSIKADERRNFDILYTLLKDTKARFYELKYEGVDEVEYFGKNAFNSYRKDILIQFESLPIGREDKSDEVINSSYGSELIEVLETLTLVYTKIEKYPLTISEKDLLLSILKLLYNRNLKLQLNQISEALKNHSEIKTQSLESVLPDLVVSEALTQQLKNLKKAIFKFQECFV